jgi:hypothetical protein
MDAKRTFLKEVIAAGLEHGTMTPDDLLVHLTAEVLADSLPKAQHAKLLSASLSSRSMSPQLIVDTLGVPMLCEHLPVHLLWACVADAAERALAGGAPATASKSAGKSAPVSKTAAAKADNGKAAAPAPKPNVSKASPAPARGGAFTRPSTSPPPVKPRGRRGSEFDVDTDVGEEWPPSDPLAEAEALGATPEIIEEHDLGDWPQEETRNVDISTGPKR